MATNTSIRMALGHVREWMGGDGRHYRREQWTIAGGEVDPSWRRSPDARGYKPSSRRWEPSSSFTLYVVDGEVNVRLVSYGGVVWPTAWTKLFETRGQGYNKATVITDAGLIFRAAALEILVPSHMECLR